MNAKKIKDKLESYYRTVTPEQVISEFEGMDVEIVDLFKNLEDGHYYVYEDGLPVRCHHKRFVNHQTPRIFIEKPWKFRIPNTNNFVDSNNRIWTWTRMWWSYNCMIFAGFINEDKEDNSIKVGDLVMYKDVYKTTYYGKVYKIIGNTAHMKIKTMTYNTFGEVDTFQRKKLNIKHKKVNINSINNITNTNRLIKLFIK